MILLGVYTVANLGCIWAVFRDEFRLNQEHKFGQALSKIHREIRPKFNYCVHPYYDFILQRVGDLAQRPANDL